MCFTCYFCRHSTILIRFCFLNRHPNDQRVLRFFEPFFFLALGCYTCSISILSLIRKKKHHQTRARSSFLAFIVDSVLEAIRIVLEFHFDSFPKKRERRKCDVIVFPLRENTQCTGFSNSPNKIIGHICLSTPNINKNAYRGKSTPITIEWSNWTQTEIRLHSIKMRPQQWLWLVVDRCDSIAHDVTSTEMTTQNWMG